VADIFTAKVRSLDEYLSSFSALVQRWSGSEGESQLWCRGQPDAEHHLVPSEYRHPKMNPDEVRSQFHRRAVPLLNPVPIMDWEWYFLMRHHGLETRLLDWTIGSLLGLYFALRDKPGHRDAAVWVLDPWAFNKWSSGRSDIYVVSDTVAKPYLPRLYRRTRALPKKPIAIMPPYNSSRITVQRGAFTIHGDNRKGLDQLFTRKLAKFVIPRDSAVMMKRALRYCGVAEYTVFPDLDGLCREIHAAELEGC